MFAVWLVGFFRIQTQEQKNVLFYGENFKWSEKQKKIPELVQKNETQKHTRNWSTSQKKSTNVYKYQALKPSPLSRKKY
jgi:hypothetical protein